MNHKAEKGFIDFPTAFEIVADADAAGAVHHDRCSWHAGMLCDCDVLKKSPEYLAAYGAPVTPPAPTCICPALSDLSRINVGPWHIPDCPLSELRQPPGQGAGA